MLTPVMAAAAGAASLGCCVFGFLYMKDYKDHRYGRSFWTKAAAAVCFILAGVCLMGACARRDFARLVVAGLVMGLCGDQILAIRFHVPHNRSLYFGAGAIAFSIGHFFYMKALFGLVGLRLEYLVPVLVLGAGAAYLYGRHHRTNAGKLQAAGVVYILWVILMAAFSISAFLAAPGPGTLLFALGGLCFGCSDNILFAYSFGIYRRWSMNIAVHVTYYAAQLLIAWSIPMI